MQHSIKACSVNDILSNEIHALLCNSGMADPHAKREGLDLVTVALNTCANGMRLISK